MNMKCSHQGGGTGPVFVNFSDQVIHVLALAKVSVKFVESHSYLTGVTTAKMQRIHVETCS